MKKYIIGLVALVFIGCGQSKLMVNSSTGTYKGSYSNPNTGFVNGKHNIEFSNNKETFKGICNASVQLTGRYAKNVTAICFLKSKNKTLTCDTKNSAMDGSLISGKCEDEDKNVYVIMNTK